ncbi:MULTISPECIES: molybdenum cofactor guanylyltransferase [Bacillaceae]|uniref:Probable molybdenum cofactor guanylyltransferase n=1 Tax=Evansella alkalicola TaxID=745819 RepID=A0ABS6JSJ5_9BACI|nr:MULTISPECIES: molybdenum cofactor guanylyltransferase [Bacillaceae]MBU9721036.1 molybdenum cofactor guanylyltransferase [Bacillus alkalicola]
MENNSFVTGIILAGGKSSRMGENKALLQIKGTSVIENIAQEIDKVVDEVIIVANHPKEYDFLNLKIVEDIYKGKGPLGGLQSGLWTSNTEWNLILACDLPFVSTKTAMYLIRRLYNFYQKPNLAVIPKINGRIHPLFGLYHKDVLQKVKLNIKEGNLRMLDLLEQIKADYVTEQDFKNGGFSDLEIERSFYNMNYPEDYKKFSTDSRYDPKKGDGAD